jgi:LmbE family N-acetylglucosaminyl deacetylase
MAKQSILFLVIFFTLSLSSVAQTTGKVILAVFAHPDDEASIAQLLFKYGRSNKVYILIATDGRLGVNPGFPTGDTLVQLRQEESRCACKILGIEPPIFLGFTDGFDTRNGMGKYFNESSELKKKLTEKIVALQPDFIITFGPDGDTGHPDHRMISNMITEVILKEGWVTKFPLFYLGWTKKDDEKFKLIGGLNTVDSNYLNITISYSQTDEDAALKAIDCYKSQYTSSDIAGWKMVEQQDSSNAFHFRQLIISDSKRSEF